MRYQTDTDFRKALEERLRQRAEQNGEGTDRVKKEEKKFFEKYGSVYSCNRMFPR
jgi:hypothetical protein